LLVVLEDVRTALSVIDLPDAWGPSAPAPRPLGGVPQDATVSVIGTDPDVSDEVFLVATGFLQPATLLHGDARSGVGPLKTAPGFFDTAGLSVEQHFAESDDGTRVPYSVVGPRERTGPAPTL